MNTTKLDFQKALMGSERTVVGNPVVRSTRSIRNLQVQNAISRAKKEAIVEKVSERLKESSLVFGMSFKGLTVAQMEGFRASLPSDQASVFICKNSLMRIAARSIEGWEDLATVTSNDNAWIFVNEDGISATVKAFLNFQQAETRAKQLEAEKDVIVEKVTSIKGGALGGKLFDPEEIEKLKELPTKTEMIGALAAMLQSIPVQLTMAINQAPQSIALRLNQISELDEDKTKVVKTFEKEQEEKES